MFLVYSILDEVAIGVQQPPLTPWQRTTGAAEFQAECVYRVAVAHVASHKRPQHRDRPCGTDAEVASIHFSAVMSSAENARSPERTEEAEEDIFDGQLNEDEVWWRDHQPWLQERGYMLRPRYRPDWVPSWHKDGGNDYYMREDGQDIVASFVSSTL